MRCCSVWNGDGVYGDVERFEVCVCAYWRIDVEKFKIGFLRTKAYSWAMQYAK